MSVFVCLFLFVFGQNYLQWELNQWPFYISFWHYLLLFIFNIILHTKVKVSKPSDVQPEQEK